MNFWKRLLGSSRVTSSGKPSQELKKYWKCPGCGSILTKRVDMLPIYSTILENGGNITGGDTCVDCGVRQEKEEVYMGKLDLNSPDALIDQIISDVANVTCDRATKSWWYKGRIVD